MKKEMGQNLSLLCHSGLSGIFLNFMAMMLFVIGATNVFAAEQNVGSVVALKGSAVIERQVTEREKRVNEAKVKDGIQLKDTVETKVNSKAKMLFIDDSVLTMGEKSKVSISEFVYSRDKGKSILNLIDGKMRTVVGKTEVEIHTPTAVAAARGTVIDFSVGIVNGILATTITSLEGIVEVRSLDPRFMAQVKTLTPGMTLTVVTGQPLSAPVPAPSGTQTTQTSRTTTSGDTGAGPKGPTGPIVVPPLPNPTIIPASANSNGGIIIPPVTPPTSGGIHVGW